MDSITIRYGETVTLPLDTGDTTAVSASIYVGKPGQQYIIKQEIDLTLGMGTFVLTPDAASPESTRVPLGEYSYQINVSYPDGVVEKYPSADYDDCDNCEGGFPSFVVCEALDEVEVS